MGLASFICVQCGNDVDISRRHYSRNTMPAKIFCDKKCRALYEKEHGHFKTMSQAGRAGRVAFLQRAKPHRKPSQVTNKKISASLIRHYQTTKERNTHHD